MAANRTVIQGLDLNQKWFMLHSNCTSKWMSSVKWKLLLAHTLSSCDTNWSIDFEQTYTTSATNTIAANTSNNNK